MSEHDTNDPQLDDELLSAYVDGELTGDQLAEVEQRLSEDSQARQLVEELRALSSEVQSLPREVVGEDLRAAVMQRAERKMLLGSDSRHTLPPARGTGSRRWAWAAMAIAATLLLSFFLPDTQQEEKPLAKAEQKASESRETNFAAAKPKGGEARFEAAEAVDEVDAMDAMDDAVGLDSLAATTAPGAADGELLAADTAKQANSGVTAPLAESVASVSSAPAMRSRAVAAPSGGGFGGGGGGLGGEGKEFPQVTCEVHITLGDGEKSAEQVDRLMQRNGIVRSDAKQESMRAAGAANEGSVASGKDVQRRQFADLDAKLKAFTKLILVEAPLETVEQTLKACSTDAFNCPTIRVIDNEQKQETGPVKRLRQWERGRDQAMEYGETFTQNQSAQQEIARYDYGQANQIADNQQIELRSAVDRKKNRKALSLKDASGPSADEASVRVLFVLQEAADLRKPLRVESEAESPAEQ